MRADATADSRHNARAENQVGAFAGDGVNDAPR